VNIYLLRHGQTNENKKGFYYGDMDIELNEVGKLQVKKVGLYLKHISFDKIFISERKRTLQTAKSVFGNEVECVTDGRLNERSFGLFEGKNYEYIKAQHQEECEKWNKDWMGYIPPKGESYIEMCERVQAFMDDIKKLQDDNILIITHSGVMRAIYCYVMDNNIDLFWKFGCKNADTALIKYEYGNFYLDSIVHCGDIGVE
jgi:alpha-ribazole phosphatase